MCQPGILGANHRTPNSGSSKLEQDLLMGYGLAHTEPELENQAQKTRGNQVRQAAYAGHRSLWCECHHDAACRGSSPGLMLHSPP